ncbi:MAG: metallophosphoesterase, partial [Vicinamibacterales bacterium]
MEPVAELLAPLANARSGAFAVLGNHDDDREMPAALARRGFEVLKDQRTTLTLRGERLDLAGIRFWTKRAADIAQVLKGTGETTILLAHDPRRLAEAAALDTQLVLSGHTHGGQVLVPGVGAIAGRKFPVLAGYATRDNTALFVSRGVGTVYVPIRINCPPEVGILTLRRQSGF